MIITRLYGGMGNQMFQYAIARAIAIRNNDSVGLDLKDLLDRTPRKGFTYRGYDLDLFNIKADILSQKQIPFWFRFYGQGRLAWYLNMLRKKLFFTKGNEKKDFVFDQNILSLKNVYLSGYWQNPKYFQDIKHILKEDFSLKNPLPKNIESLRQEILNKESLCIHVRRGDYVGNKAHDILPSDYYQKSLEKFKNIKIDHIYIFSDDIDWCRENMSFGIDTTFVGDEYSGERAIGHFELMRSCKHFIIPNSTFSWWAAYLSDRSGIVFAPDGWIVFDINKMI